MDEGRHARAVLAIAIALPRRRRLLHTPFRTPSLRSIMLRSLSSDVTNLPHCTNCILDTALLPWPSLNTAYRKEYGKRVAIASAVQVSFHEGELSAIGADAERKVRAPTQRKGEGRVMCGKDARRGMINRKSLLLCGQGPDHADREAPPATSPAKGRGRRASGSFGSFGAHSAAQHQYEHSRREAIQ